MGKPKIKLYSGIKTCTAGERYVFRDGYAVIPGFYAKSKSSNYPYEVTISIEEFKQLIMEIQNAESEEREAELG